MGSDSRARDQCTIIDLISGTLGCDVLKERGIHYAQCILPEIYSRFNISKLIKSLKLWNILAISLRASLVASHLEYEMQGCDLGKEGNRTSQESSISGKAKYLCLRTVQTNKRYFGTVLTIKQWESGVEGGQVNFQ